MKVLLASSEVVPFSKTGGLADVATSLSKALAWAGVESHVITPFYPRQWEKIARVGGERPILEPTDEQITVTVGRREVSARLIKSRFPGSKVTVWLLDQPQYFDRKGIYVEGEHDYADNCERFVFFSRAVFEAARKLNLRPDVIHANDWQTGLVPALLATQFSRYPDFGQTASVYTIHNLAFQGRFWHWDMMLTGIDWKYFNWRQMEFFGDLNLMKAGIAFANAVTTVSPTYAQEIQTAEFGCGLESALSDRASDLYGVLNGIDTEEWDPARDPYLAHHYTVDDVGAGKAACKATLQQKMGLPYQPYEMTCAIVSRMTGQKGFQLLTGCAETLLHEGCQLVILGSGEAGFESWTRDLATRYPDRVAARIGYDEALSHEIIAGADVFLMPSQYEPCGLTQMYSLRYGTIPVVRAVGGLADSVVDLQPHSLADHTANGFSFCSFSAEALLEAVRRAHSAYHDRQTWQQLIRNGMRRDWSWSRSAAEYLRIYERVLAQRHSSQPLG